MDAGLSIRRYRPNDHERVLRLHAEPMADVDAFVDENDELDADLEDIEAAYLDRGGDFLVGEFDGRIVAVGAFKPPSAYFEHFLEGVELPERTAEITRMRVDADYQGRGFGEAIYDDLERRARADGVETLLLDTTPGQRAARGLYEKKGFEEILRTDVELDGERLTMVIYRKDL